MTILLWLLFGIGAGPTLPMPKIEAPGPPVTAALYASFIRARATAIQDGWPVVSWEASADGKHWETIRNLPPPVWLKSAALAEAMRKGKK